MKKMIILFFTLLLACLPGCGTLHVDEDGINALIVTPYRFSNSDGGNLIYPIGSAFAGGSILPEKGSSHRCRFYRKNYSTGPDWFETEPLVAIEGFEHKDIEYTKPGQQIDRIYIYGLDDSLGLGTSLAIPMNQGKYEAGNPMIRNVKINAYQLSPDKNTKGASIDIVITSMAGDVIQLRFRNEKIANDGYL